jgi:hypothetical protein
MTALQRSHSPAAARQRLMRRRRKRGLRGFMVYLPIKELTAAVAERERENLPAGAVPSDGMIKRAIDEGCALWLSNWLHLKKSRVTRR